MKLLITGAQGFIGKNLIAELEARKTHEILTFDLESAAGDLERHCQSADFVIHLAGINRPDNPDDFMQGNYGLTSLLLDALKSAGNTCPVLLASSIQAMLDNPYGKSKKAGEDLLLDYGCQTGAIVYIYRFPNVFGKWSRPHYNSAIATFCHNIARGLPIQINDPSAPLQLVYIDDVMQEIMRAIEGRPNQIGTCCEVPVTFRTTVGRVAELIESFRTCRSERTLPDLSDDLTRHLYSTYLSFLPVNEFAYPLTVNRDARGSFTEFVRTIDRGQFSVNVAKPGIVKGNHWHHSKHEKFLTVSGQGVIRFRQLGQTTIHTYPVSGDHLEVVEVPPGYTHNLENTGTDDLVLLIWASEPFDPQHPDTMFLEV